MAPALANDPHTSQTREVGAIFTFTLTAGLNSLTAADNVEVVDNLPAGLELLSVQDADGGARQALHAVVLQVHCWHMQQPANAPEFWCCCRCCCHPPAACDYTLKQIKCNWKRLAPSDKKVIKVQVKAVTAGTHTNPAYVTTTSNDTNPDNDRDQAKAIVKVQTAAHPEAACVCACARLLTCVCCLCVCAALPTCAQGACCIKSTSTATCNNVLPAACIGGEFNPKATCDGSTCIPLPPQVGACCIPELGRCRERVPRSQCMGTWFNQRVCSQISCAVPTGACCNPSTGTCSEGVAKDGCPGAATNWRAGGKCADGFCSGACCAADKGTCSQQLKKNCMPPSTWTLYKECDANTCPSPDVSAGEELRCATQHVPMQCSAGVCCVLTLATDARQCACCRSRPCASPSGTSAALRATAPATHAATATNAHTPTRTAQQARTCASPPSSASTRAASVAATLAAAAAPVRMDGAGAMLLLTPVQLLRGLKHACICRACAGTCRWDYASRQGRCSSAPRCIAHGRSCHKGSTDCCPGSRCVHGSCSTATYDKCKRKCHSYECVQERKMDCDCFYASAAASKR